MCESFFATLECELLDRRRFASQAEARMACFSFIEGWSNPVRLPFGPRLPVALGLRGSNGEHHSTSHNHRSPSPLHGSGAASVRRNHQIVSVAVIVAVGVSTDDGREVLGMTNRPQRGRAVLGQVLRSLARRGLRGVKLVVSDAHEGLKAASPRCSAPHGKGAACISYAMPRPMRARPSTASSPPGSEPRLPRTTPLPPASSGARWPTRHGRVCLSWPG